MRTEQVLAIRSQISTDADRLPLEIEAFDHRCIRPILKFQNDVLMALFKGQVLDLRIPEKEKEREDFVRLRLQKDLITRNTLIAMVLGMMTAEELAFYLSKKQELSRRIIGMMVQRISGQL
jgi:hypothetical protein